MALFFAPAWQHKKPEKRIAGITQLDASNKLSVCSQLASQDPDAAVRAAARQQLGIEQQIGLLNSTTGDAQAELRASVSQAIQAKQHDLEKRQRWLRNAQSPELYHELASSAQEPAIRKTALRQAKQQQLWQQAVCQDPDPSLRQYAAEQIESLKALEQLIEQLRLNDKTTTRMLQQLLNQRRLDDGDENTIQQLQKNCCIALEKLIETQADKSALRPIDTEWAQLLGARIGPANKAAQKLAERYQRSRRVFLRLHEPAPEPQPETPAAETQPAIREELRQARRIADSATQLLANTGIIKRNKVSKLRKHWRTLKTEIDDSQLLENITELLSQLNQKLLNQDAEWKAKLEQLREAIPSVKPLLDSGQLQAARDLYDQLRDQLQQLQAVENKAELKPVREALQNLEPDLRKLGDWQHWSNNRQRRDLCEKMEALVGKDIEPDALAAAIKDLQAAWKNLEQTERREGKSGKASPALWRRFQTAGHKAWEPCAEHFSKKRENRSLKREHIAQVVADLEKFADKAKKFDEQVVQTTVSRGYRFLGELRRMPRKESRALIEQLQTALAPFEQVRESQQKQAAYAKQQLIDKAKLANPEEDLGNAIRQIKQLQADWKKTGRANPKQDRELWQAFRQEADRVFAVLDTQRQAKKTEKKAAIQQLKQNISQITALAENPSEQTAAELHKLSDEAETAASQADDRKLSRQLNDAIQAVEKALAAEQKNQQLEALQQRIQAAESRQQNNASAEQQAAARDAVIRLEILAGLSSPSQDQTRRLELQVEQLAANLQGKGNKSILKLADHWYQQSITTPQEWQQLHARVQAALKQ